jgi:hypothetical protein
MQLSLRTLLAFEDNIFDTEQQRRLERIIPAHEPSSQILARIRSVIRDPHISVPGRNNYQEELDPNIVAEYLDYQMSKEYQDQFENFCLASDKYLAELASVHQIISNVLGEPARISRECRFRCYDLFPKIQNHNNHYETKTQLENLTQLQNSLLQQSQLNQLNQLNQQIITHPQLPPQNTTINTNQNIFPTQPKNEKEKITNYPKRKFTKDAATITTIIIVAALLLLNYNYNNINTKNITATKTQQNLNQTNNPQITQPKQTKTENTQNQNPNTQNQNIRTVSTITENINENITPAAEINAAEINAAEINTTEINTTESNTTEINTCETKPLPLPQPNTDNNINNNPTNTQIDPFNTSPNTNNKPDTQESIFNASPKIINNTTKPEPKTNPEPQIPQNINETEINFREKNTEPKILDSSVWKTKTPNNQNQNIKPQNIKPPIITAGGNTNYTNTQIIQANNNTTLINHDHNLNNNFENNFENANKQPQNQNITNNTQKQGILGAVITTNDPMVIFTAKSYESQWQFKSNQFDIYANQYILTAAPFRADIKLGDDFIVEMIGDTKLSVLPPTNGITTIYIDYGRLVIHATYDNPTLLKPVKTIRICTEHGETTIGFNGAKSVAFVDTFAEISRNITPNEYQQNPNLNPNSNSINAINQNKETQIGMNPILGLLPDPTESISWITNNQNNYHTPAITKNDISIVLANGKTERGIIRNHPNWLRRTSTPEEGKQIESACINIFNQKNINLESALQTLSQEKSETTRAFAYRIWGDLGRFDIPLKAKIHETNSIQLALIQYFKEVIKRDKETIQRLTEAIKKERNKN